MSPDEVPPPLGLPLLLLGRCVGGGPVPQPRLDVPREACKLTEVTGPIQTVAAAAPPRLS